jgi:hypothetical protein
MYSQVRKPYDDWIQGSDLRAYLEHNYISNVLIVVYLICLLVLSKLYPITPGSGCTLANNFVPFPPKSNLNTFN